MSVSGTLPSKSRWWWKTDLPGFYKLNCLLFAFIVAPSSLLKTAGMAPFSRKISKFLDALPGKIDSQFDVWTERSATIEKLSGHVELTFKRQYNMLTAAITLIALLISLILGGVNFYYYTEIKGLSIEFSRMQSQVAHILEETHDGGGSLLTIYKDDLYRQYCNRIQTLEQKLMIASITLLFIIILIAIAVVVAVRHRPRNTNREGGS